MKMGKKYKNLTSDQAVEALLHPKSSKRANGHASVGDHGSRSKACRLPENGGRDTPTDSNGRNFVAPRTPSEQLMVSIWQDILKMERIGIFENFFDIVNDSFLAMEVIERTRKTFSVKLPVRDLFTEPTVAGMTAAVLRCQHQDNGGVLLPIGPVAYKPKSNARKRFSRGTNRFSE